MRSSTKIRGFLILVILLLIFNCSWFSIISKDTVSCDFIAAECNCDADVINNQNCFKIYSDTHIFGGKKQIAGMKKNIHYNIEYMNVTFPSYKERTFYIGDIIDLSKAEPKDKASARNEILKLRKALGNNHVRGNHEMDSFGEIGENRYMVHKGKILFTHGHQFRYPEERTDYLESSRKEEHEPWDPSRSDNEVFMEAAKQARKHGCSVVVFGHTHPTELDERTIDGIKIINVKAGRSYLYILVDSTYRKQNNY
jgi:predicted phosphodiesterase